MSFLLVKLCMSSFSLTMHTAFPPILTGWGGGFYSQLMFGCRWYALLLTRSVNTQLALCGALGVTGRRLVAVAGRLVVEVG
jgi:hypothetical protein